MLNSFWAFLKDPTNRQILELIGGGIVAVVGGIWAVIKFRVKDHSDPPPSVRAQGGGVAAGRDITGSSINTGGRGSAKR